MFEKRRALSVPIDPFSLQEHRELVLEARQRGYTDAWSYEIDGLDCFSPLAYVAMSTDMRVGTAIANVFSRGPAALAQTAAGLADIAPGRFHLGLGTGSEVTVGAWNNVSFTKPATRVREMVAFLRTALAGERVVFDGETFKVNGFRLSRPPAQPVPIHVAALRPGMLRLAGEVGDGVILNWLSPSDVRKSVGVVREAASAAGRDPNSIEVLARLMVCVDDDSETSGVGMRRTIAGYMNVPVYRKFQEWLGRGPALRPMWEAWDAGDRRAALAAIPDSLISELMPHGAAGARREMIQAYLDAGVDTVFFMMYTYEQDPGRQRQRLAEALREMGPSAR